MKLALLSFPLLLLVTSCSLTPKDVGQSYMFALDPVKIAQLTSLPYAVVIALPSAAPELDTYRIALRNRNTWDYYAGAKWVEFLPVLVQDNLVTSLEFSGLFHSVSADDAGVPGKYVLQTEIRRFHAEYASVSKAPSIHVWIVARLVNQSDRSVAASFEGKAIAKAKADSLTEIQSAFQQGFNAAELRLLSKLRDAVTENSSLPN